MPVDVVEPGAAAAVDSDSARPADCRFYVSGLSLPVIQEMLDHQGLMASRSASGRIRGVVKTPGLVPLK
jgi:hypothetical protein